MTGILSLESPRWRELTQAYGTAEDIPALIAHLPPAGDAERDELWFGLWSTLCHQGDAYSGSYAALPHLVAYAAPPRPPAECARALHLVGAIEISRIAGRGPALPDDLATAYRDALAAVPSIVAAQVGSAWDADTTQILASVLAIAKGHPRFGNAALNLEPLLGCPVCDAPFPPPGWDLGADA